MQRCRGHSDSMDASGGTYHSGLHRRWALLLVWTASLVAHGTDAATGERLIVPLDDIRFQVAGNIVVHRTERTVTVPAVVNQQRGLVEYLLVHTTGKRHEALFSTGVAPQHLHLACLLVGAPETGAAAVELAGLEVRWQGHGPASRSMAEDLLQSATHDGEPISGATMARARWSYHGSRFTRDGFAAQVEGNCIALQADAAALLQAPGLLAGEYVPYGARLPAVGSPVSIVLTFPPPRAASAVEEHP